MVVASPRAQDARDLHETALARAWREARIRHGLTWLMRLSARPRLVFRLNELTFDRVTMEQAVRRIVRMAKRRDRPRYVCTGNLDHLVIAERDPEFRDVYRNADFVVADGKPLVWLSKIAARGWTPIGPSALPGAIAKASGETRLRLFLLGGVEGVAEGERRGRRLGGKRGPVTRADWAGAA